MVNIFLLCFLRFLRFLCSGKGFKNNLAAFIPEAITQGDDLESALKEASDCLEEAIAARIDDQRDLPIPSPLISDEYLVYLPIQTALKASVYLAMKESSLSKVQLASLLNYEYEYEYKYN